MILKKILPILKNLDLIEDLGTFLFTPFEYQFPEWRLRKIALEPFKVRKIIKNKISIENITLVSNSKLINVEGLSDFFKNILKSKDGQFVELAVAFLNRLVEYIWKNKTIFKFYS